MTRWWHFADFAGTALSASLLMGSGCGSAGDPAKGAGGSGGGSGGSTTSSSGGSSGTGSGGGTATGDAGGVATGGGANDSGAVTGDGGAVDGGGATSPDADAGGATDGGGGTTGDGGQGGTGDGGAAGFVCNQVTAMTLTREWYVAGFENIVDNARWQLKAREHGYITEWANPNSAFWSQTIDSPCTQSSTSPDRVVLTVLDWTNYTQQQWETEITNAINDFKTKYSGLKRIDLLTIIRGPGNMACGAPAAGETIVMPAALDAAIATMVTQFPGFAFAGPKFEAPDCTVFNGGGPHLTTAGNTALAKTIGAYFATIQ